MPFTPAQLRDRHCQIAQDHAIEVTGGYVRDRLNGGHVLTRVAAEYAAGAYYDAQAEYDAVIDLMHRELSRHDDEDDGWEAFWEALKIRCAETASDDYDLAVAHHEALAREAACGVAA